MLLLSAFLVFFSGNGFAAAIITITSTGAADYSIATTDLPESAGMELVITYDTATLEAPLVKAGALTAGAMMEKNIGTPGTIRLIIVTGGTIKGSGQLASLAFTKKGSGPAPLPRLTSSVYSTTGSQLAVQSSNPQPQPQTSSTAAETAGSAVTDTSQVTGQTSTVPASVNSAANAPTAVVQGGLTVATSGVFQQPAAEQGIPTRDASPTEEIRDDPMNRAVTDSAASAGTAPVTMEEEVAVAAPAVKAATEKAHQLLKTNRSVPDRFRTFDGVRTVKNLAQLFNAAALQATGIVQTPAIAVSDGTSLVKITVDRIDTGEEPSFSLKGANQKALRKVSDRKWELEALPQKGKTDVRLSIIQKNERTEIPLVVVHQLDQTKTHLAALSESSVNALLAKPVVNKKPAYDLNSDGKQDYLDDYLLIAHWLLKQKPGTKGVSPKPAATGK
jgi:hypothetical protein